MKILKLKQVSPNPVWCGGNLWLRMTDQHDTGYAGKVTLSIKYKKKKILVKGKIITTLDDDLDRDWFFIPKDKVNADKLSKKFDLVSS